MSLRARLAAAPGGPVGAALLVTPEGRLDRAEAAALGPGPGVVPTRRVALCIADPLALARVLAGLDGAVAGMLLLSAALPAETVAALMQVAECSLLVTDRPDLAGALPGTCAPEAAVAPGAEPGTTPGAPGAPGAETATAWMMTTSGTTGLPKIVPHTLASLSRSVRRDPLGRVPVWGLVLEMTRFAGLQVALQAMIGGGTLAAAPRAAPVTAQIGFLAAAGVTHLSATPTLWRRLLMAPGVAALPLRQITMGGEIADQGVLDAAAARFPEARITHIYASTEAGVGFAVNDRKAGFPRAFTETTPGGVGVRITDGVLWLRPPEGRAVRYLGGQALDVDAEGHVCTGDRIEIRGDRAHFLGRDSGVVNVGGAKVHPERVERVIAAVPGVGLASVTAKPNPITGALLMAVVVPADPGADRGALKDAIIAACRAGLEREAVPARITFAESLETNAAGKIVRA